MMPQVAPALVHRGRHRRIRLWIPLLLVLLVLSPLLLVAGLVLVVVCVTYRVDPGRSLVASWRLVMALRGLRVEVSQGRNDVLVRII